MKTVLLVNDTDGRENIGCRLTSTTLKQGLVDAYDDAGEGCRIVPAPWSFASVVRSTDPALLAALRGAGDPLAEGPLRALAAAEYGEAALAALAAADHVIYQPEGTLSNDADPLRILRHLSLPLYALLWSGRPLAVLNGTFPTFEDERRPLIAGLLSGSAGVALRDRLSADHWGQAFAPDTAVLFPGTPPGPDVHGTHLLMTTGAEISRAEDRALAERALEVCAAQGLRPLVLTKAWKRLAPLRRRIAALDGEFHEYATLDEADALLSRCRLHVGGRYHMALLCATKGVPSALVPTNTHKNAWLAAEFDGIALARSRDGIGPEAARLLGQDAPPRTDLLEDVARCRDLCRVELRRVCGALLRSDTARPPETDGWLPEAFRAAMRRRMPRDRMKFAVKRLLRT